MVLKPIKITDKQKRLLDKLKAHPRQPYHEVLQEILKPLEIPSFTVEEKKLIIKKFEHLRSIVRKADGEGIGRKGVTVRRK